MANPTIIYTMKENFVEVELIGRRITTGLNDVGISYQNISYLDFYNILQATKSLETMIRATSTSELQAVLKAMTGHTHSIGDTVVYPKKTIKFSKRESDYELQQLITGSESFKVFNHVLDSGKVKQFDINSYIITTQVSPRPSTFRVDDIKVYLLLDIAYTRDREPRKVEIPILSKYLNDKIKNTEIADLSKINTLDLLQNLDLTELSKQDGWENVQASVLACFKNEINRINWGVN